MMQSTPWTAPPAGNSKYRGVLAALVLLSVALGVGGCALPGVIAYKLFGERSVSYNAQYTGLNDRSVAVLVAADQYLLSEYPMSQQALTQRLSAEIQENVEGAQILPPSQVLEYTQEHPYWMSRPLSNALNALEVERLVVVDLGTYQTHEPGNPNVQQGVVSGQVAVYEAEAADQDNADFADRVRVEFPEDISIGLVNEDHESIEQGMVRLFSRDAARLFHPYEATVDR